LLTTGPLSRPSAATISRACWFSARTSSFVRAIICAWVGLSRAAFHQSETHAAHVAGWLAATMTRPSATSRSMAAAPSPRRILASADLV
jgi:hypothetical protein